MTYTYTIPNGIDGEPSKTMILRSDGAWIPTDPANSDYQAYLASLNDNPPTTPTATPTA